MDLTNKLKVQITESESYANEGVKAEKVSFFLHKSCKLSTESDKEMWFTVEHCSVKIDS